MSAEGRSAGHRKGVQINQFRKVEETETRKKKTPHKSKFVTDPLLGWKPVQLREARSVALKMKRTQLRTVRILSRRLLGTPTRKTLQ